VSVELPPCWNGAIQVRSSDAPAVVPVVLGLLLATTLPAGAAGPPNILFVLTDDMRRDDLEAMPLVKQLLVDRGVTFANAYVNVPLCCPSRATILRGQYSHNTKVYGNREPFGGCLRFRNSGPGELDDRDRALRRRLPHGALRQVPERLPAAEPVVLPGSDSGRMAHVARRSGAIRTPDTTT
jgi:hypothetical protein